MLAIASIIATVLIYESFALLQRKIKLMLLNPMLLALFVIVPSLLWLDINYEQYNSGAKYLNYLLEPIVVALGFPLFEQLKSIRTQWKILLPIIAAGSIIAMLSSLLFAMVVGSSEALSISMALKSITTPIALELTASLGGLQAVTALAIMFAGIFGATFGMSLLRLIGVDNVKAQGLAIGTASHAFGTATISKISFEHGAYGSLALIFSAIITAIVSPWLIPFFFQLAFN